MADDEKEAEVAPPRGADWEVVSLTASTYAAAPDPRGFNPEDDDENRQESSDAIFMSQHFVFPPNEHENLPIEPDYSEMHKVSEVKRITSLGEGEEEGRDKLDDDLQGTDYADDGSDFIICGMELEEGKDLECLHSVPYTEDTEIANPVYSQDPNSPLKRTPIDDDNYDASGHPCVAWWKKHVSSIYHHAKEANTFWSIFVAAALTGLVILGKRWHRDKWHAHELRRHLNINEENVKGMMGPVGRLKNIIIGSH